MFLSGAAGKKLGKKMVDEQEIVMNLADILADAFVCDSAYLKIRKMETGDADKAKLSIQRAMLQIYLYESLERTRKTALDAIAAYAQGSEKAMAKYVVGKLLKSYDVNPKALRRQVVAYMVKENGYAF